MVGGKRHSQLYLTHSTEYSIHSIQLLRTLFTRAIPKQQQQIIS